MARRKPAVERVTLTSPHGTQVAVSKDKAEQYIARGYKAPAKKSTAKPAADDK